MNRLFAVGLAVLAGCAQFQQVEIVAPANAHVVLAGSGGERFEANTPFVGNFEAIAISSWGLYDLTFTLDAASAARYGAKGPITLYGKLGVAAPTKVSSTLTLELKMPDDKIAALVGGNRVEIETFVEDPNTTPPTELARLTLRAAPF